MCSLWIDWYWVKLLTPSQNWPSSCRLHKSTNCSNTTATYGICWPMQVGITTETTQRGKLGNYPKHVYQRFRILLSLWTKQKNLRILGIRRLFLLFFLLPAPLPCTLPFWNPISGPPRKQLIKKRAHGTCSFWGLWKCVVHVICHRPDECMIPRVNLSKLHADKSVKAHIVVFPRCQIFMGPIWHILLHACVCGHPHTKWLAQIFQNVITPVTALDPRPIGICSDNPLLFAILEVRVILTKKIALKRLIWQKRSKFCDKSEPLRWMSLDGHLAAIQSDKNMRFRLVFASPQCECKNVQRLKQCFPLYAPFGDSGPTPHLWQ